MSPVYKVPHLLLFCLLTSSLCAQTDYVYVMTDNATQKSVNSLAMNSRSYRLLPDSPHQLEFFDYDQNISFQSSIHFTEPGSYTYFSRFRPDQIYGYHRNLDGTLILLPGFPITVPSITDPDRNIGGLISLKKHPYLPVFYSIHARDDVVRCWHVLVNGQIQELGTSPFQFFDDQTGIQGFAISADGSTLFLNSMTRGAIIKGSLDPKTGMIHEIEIVFEHGERGRDALLSEDERYLFTTNFVSPNIGRYRIEGDQLVRLYPDFIADHDVVWLWRKGNLIVSGATAERKASAFLIQADGSLVAGPNSPFDVFSNTLWYADFSPSRNRVYFGGNTFLQVYDYDLDGTMHLAANSGFQIDGWGLGLSVAPEIRGDPYSLQLRRPQTPQATFSVSGDPDTVFYLRVADRCEGPYITDSNGQFTTTYIWSPDLHLEILAYCDEQLAADAIQTVPTLHPTALLMLILCLGFAAVYNRKMLKKE